jgi:hypothetical protein
MQPMKSMVLAAMVCATFGAAQVLAAENVITKGGVSFVSGGVGADSQERLKAREKEFNLKLVFTLVEGNYLSDVAVAVKDAAGKTLIEHLADGPFFLARLPAGLYTVSATYAGRTHTLKVKLGERLRTEHLRWPADPKADVTLPPGRAK